MPLSSIAPGQANQMEETMQKYKQFLDYVALQEEVVLTFRASDIILEIHSDASYLLEAKAWSRAEGHFFMSSHKDIPGGNGAVINISHIIKAVMSSAAEAGLRALFINAELAVPILTSLVELGHP